MFNTATKRIGWFCLFCVIYLCGWITFNVVAPSLKAPHPTRPIFKVRTGRFGSEQIAFSPKGTEILCLYNSKTGGNSIKRWNYQTAKRLPPITSPEEFYLLSRDGRYYATSNAFREFHIYDTSDRKQIVTFPTDGALKDITGEEPLAISVRSKSYSYNKNNPYTSTWRYYIRNIRTHQLLNPNSALNTRSIHDSLPDESTAISPDGFKIFSLIPAPTEEQKNYSWKARNQQTPALTKVKRINRLTGETDMFPAPIKFLDPFSKYEHAQISNNNKLYAAISTHSDNHEKVHAINGTIWCYDLPHQKLRWKYFQQDHFPILLKFSPDGTMLAAGGHNDDVRGVTGFVSIIDAKTGKLIHEYTEQTLRDQLNDRAKLAYFNGQKSTFSKINFYLEKLHLNTLYSDHDTFVNQLAPNDSGVPAAISWSPDSKTLAISYFFGDVKIWRVKE